MNFTAWLQEAERSRPVVPRQTDPNNPQDQLLQKVSKTGDVGQAETLGKVYNEPTPTNARGLVKLGKRLATDTGTAEFGDTQDPVDRALDITRGPARYQRNITPQSISSVPRPRRADFRGDRDAYAAAMKDYEDQVSRVSDARGLDVDAGGETEFDKLPQAQRQDIAGAEMRKAGRGSAASEVEDALIDVRRRAAELEAREPIVVKMPDGSSFTVYDTPDDVHANQRSGLEIGDPEEDADYVDPDDVGYPQYGRDEDGKINMSLRDIQDLAAEPRQPGKLSQSDIEKLVSVNTDRDKQKLDPSPDTMMRRGGIDNTNIKTPSARDMDTIYSDEYFDALDKQDAKAIQDIAFVNDVSDDDLDNFLSQYNTTGQGNNELVQKLKMLGLTGERTDRVYGGDLGPEAEKYRVKGKGVPDGIYDLDKMKADGSNLEEKLLANRGRELVRTWLKQGGVNGYAPHEGVRSIADLDMEHIRALKSKDGPGYDHPSNWLWASGNINQFRKNVPATQATDKLKQGEVTRTYDKKAAKKAYDDFVADRIGEKPKGKEGQEWEAMKDLLDSQLGGAADGRGGTGPFQPTTAKNRSPEEIEKERERLVKTMGMSPEQAAGMIGDVHIGRNTGAIRNINLPGTDSRTARTPYDTDPEQFKQDVRTEKRDERAVQQFIKNMKKYPQFAKKKEEQIMTSDIGKEFSAQLQGWGPSKTRELGEPVPSPRTAQVKPATPAERPRRRI